jgi:predicted DNA-binding transcriptional regulator AlpA
LENPRTAFHAQNLRSAKRLNISRLTVYRMIEDGRLPKPIKLTAAKGGALRFDPIAVEVAIARMVQQP